MNKLIIIAAVGKNLELGYNNDLIWHIKDDMKFFKENTMNHHILMGKNTFVSLPGILPDRKHIILTSRCKNCFSDKVIVINSINEFNSLKDTIDDDIYVIGGAKVYSEFIDIADELLLTEIDDEYKDADVYFPNIKYEDFDKKVLKENRENKPPYKHVLYKRKNQEKS